MTLGEKIKIIRETVRMSQREFAEALGCAQSLVSSYELDKKKPSYNLLVLIDSFAIKNKIKIKLL